MKRGENLGSAEKFSNFVAQINNLYRKMSIEEITPGKIICFDAEMAGNQRLIELSVYDYSGSEIYHSYYNPGPTREWREDIHHISREMVAGAPKFEDELKRVQRLIDDAEIIIGCAIKNDVEALEAGGVRGLDKKRVVEIQDWYWLLRARNEGVSLYQRRSLAAIAEEFGVDFNEGEMHSAGGDTAVTLKCFKILKDEFMQQNELPSDADISLLFSAYDNVFGEARKEFLRGEAKGFVQLLSVGNDFELKFNQKVEHRHDRCVEIITVNDRFVAEMELKKMFAKRAVKGEFGVYRLKKGDIEKFKEYSNEYDEERSEFCRQFSANRLGRFSDIGFNIKF